MEGIVEGLGGMERGINLWRKDERKETGEEKYVCIVGLLYN